MSTSPDRKALSALVFGAAVIGAGSALVRLTGTGAAAAGWWRLAFAAPLLLGLTWREQVRTAGGRWRLGASPLLLGVCGFAFATDLIFWHYSLHLTTVANSTVLANMTPVIVTVAAWAALGERPAPAFVGGLGCAVAGAVVMALARRSNGAAGSSPLLGDGLALGASTSYAVYFMLVRIARRTASAYQVMLASSIVGAPLVLAAAFVLHERILPATALGWSACVALGIMHVSGQGAIAWSLGRVPTAPAAVIMLSQPVVAALTAWVVFSEAIGPMQALGGAVALGGVALAQTAARPPPPPLEGEAEAAAAL